MASASHWLSYPRFLWKAITQATDGSLLFYTWMTLLSALFLVGVALVIVQQGGLGANRGIA